jgi:hypothetical protein
VEGPTLLSGKDVQTASDIMCFSQGVECESGDELTTTGLEICLQGTEHLLLCGHHSPGLASILFVILTTHAILPHNDSFPLLTAAFIHF